MALRSNLLVTVYTNTMYIISRDDYSDTSFSRSLFLEIWAFSGHCETSRRFVGSSSMSYSLMTVVVVPSCPRLDCQWRDGAGDGSHLRFPAPAPSPGARRSRHMAALVTAQAATHRLGGFNILAQTTDASLAKRESFDLAS